MTAAPSSEKTVAVLTLSANGHSYRQSLDGHPGVTYHDIFAAAEEALRVNEATSDYHAWLGRIASKYPGVHAKWTGRRIASDDAFRGKIR